MKNENEYGKKLKKNKKGKRDYDSEEDGQGNYSLGSD